MKPIDEISFLPKSSKNQELEELSKKKFAPLFDEGRFLLKGEVKDNGIDFRNEVIRNGSFIGFGFNFQLKSRHEARRNRDGSYSKQLETKNIEYLLNNGQPAFYGFYIKNEDQFYFAYLNEIIRDLQKEKGDDWEDQEYHTIRFSKVLNADSVNEIYDITVSEGIRSRKIAASLIELAVMLPEIKDEKVVITPNTLEVYDDHKIRRYIESDGFSLINETKWSEIVELHQKATGAVSSTSLYCAIVAIAYFYKGQFFDAIPLFRRSIQLQQSDSLAKKIVKYRDYHFLITKLRVGLIDDKVYSQEVAAIVDDPLIALYQKLEDYRNQLRNLPENKADNFKEFEKKLFEVINDENIPNSIRIIYQSEYLLHLGYRFNLIDNIKIAVLKTQEEQVDEKLMGLRSIFLDERMKQQEFLTNGMNTLLEKSKAHGNTFISALILLNDSRLWYQRTVFSDVFNLIEPEELTGIEREKEKIIQQVYSNLDFCIKYFETIGHIENSIACLGLKYEVSHYSKDEEKISVVREKLLELVTTVASDDESKKVRYLLDGGTMHEEFHKYLVGQKSAHEEFVKEHSIIISAMRDLDKKEVEYGVPSGDSIHIQLVPMGYFAVPPQALDELIAFLNLEQDAKNQVMTLVRMGVVPTLNILHNPISKEGYLDGRRLIETKDIGIWRRMFEIRQYLFEEKILRIEGY